MKTDNKWLLTFRKILILALLLITVPALAQNVKNPTLLTFTSIDWATVDRHEIEIIRTSDSVVVQTLVDSGPYTDENIMVGINVMPVAFGEYVIMVRACAGTLCSDESDQSNLWDRVPGRPSKPTAQ